LCHLHRKMPDLHEAQIKARPALPEIQGMKA
jgi:hypothetical protein